MMKDKRQQDKDRVFGFLKKYITLSMVTILLVISFVFFTVYRNLEISRVTGSSISGLLQLGLSCNSLFDSINKLLFQIYDDRDISDMVNAVNLDITTTIRANTRLASFTLTGTDIISIYVYSKQTDCFYSTLPSTPKQSKTDFLDREAVYFIDNIQNIEVLNPIPRKIKLYTASDVTDHTLDVYTLIYNGLPKFSTANFNKVVIVNVSEEWVRKSIELWNKEMNGNVCIINNKGTLVSSLYKDNMLQDISQEEFVDKILKSKKQSGYFECNVSGVKSFVTYVYSSKLGWFFIRAIPYSIIYENLEKIIFIAIGLFLLYVAIGFILSFIITRKAKKSIDDIIDGLKSRINDNRNDLDKLKEEFLLSSLYNNVSASPEQMRKDFEKYNIMISPDKILLLVLFKIDHYHELCTRFKSYDIAVLRQAIMKTASELFCTKYIVETVDMKDDHVVLAFNCTDSPEHIAVSKVDSLIKLVQDSVEKNIQVSLSAVLSPSGYTINDINLLYSEAKQASNYRMFFGHKCIIHSEGLKILSPEKYIFPTGKEKMLLHTLMLGKAESAGELLDEIIDSTHGYPYTILNSLLLRLTSSISSTFESIDSISKYSIDYNFNSFLETLNKCETVTEIRNRFSDMFVHVFSILEEKKNSKYELLVNKVIDIINQDYADKNLCLNSIAARINLSSGYLGKLFKTYTSKSVSDYINQIRIESASKMLEYSTLSINDILSKIGFTSNNYFYTVFRKTFGITPSEYREKMRTKDQSLI